jgi:hypothetical protein
MKQPRFTVTVTYTDEAKAPGSRTGTLKAVSTWLGTQKGVAKADMKPVPAESQ